MRAGLEQIIRGAIGYDRVPLSVPDHPEIRFGFRTSADADGITERVVSALIAAGWGLTMSVEARASAALAIARSMPGWNEDTSEPGLEPGPLRDAAEAHWVKVNETCLQMGGEYVDAVLAAGYDFVPARRRKTPEGDLTND